MIHTLNCDNIYKLKIPRCLICADLKMVIEPPINLFIDVKIEHCVCYEDDKYYYWYKHPSDDFQNIETCIINFIEQNKYRVKIYNSILKFYNKNLAKIIVRYI